jgi:prephenate dehydrogenase
MTTTIIGLGLIGGSMALDLKNCGFCDTVIGVDLNKDHEKQAVSLKLVDKVLPLPEAVRCSDLVIVAVPVDATVTVISEVMKYVDRQVVSDVGSTKELIVNSLINYPNRGRFVAAHPIWGTEKSGPTAALPGGFKDRLTVICNNEESDKDALEIVESMYVSIGMKMIYMDAVKHDIHAAYISHISHITSFALALTVLEKEKEIDSIFQLAGAGFESTVRLAKSNPDTWMPIFSQNKENLLEVIDEHILQLQNMKQLLESEDYETFHKLMAKANQIGKVLGD